ncbi:hypothetical protein KDK88_09455 [bacterium]|nr:hypothetical protein [bacterium]
MIHPRRCLILVLSALAAALPAHALSLRAAYEAAPARDGYDRDVVLEPGRVYTGGLLIGPSWDEDLTLFQDMELGLDVRIQGNGAVLDMGGESLTIAFCGKRLDVTDCVVVDGSVRFRGDVDPGRDRTPEGSVRHCTFYRPRDYAVRLQGVGEGVLLERNIVVDAVDSGPDGLIWTGILAENLPTGLAFGLSVQAGFYGTPVVRENWTWFSDPAVNAEPLHHFGFL